MTEPVVKRTRRVYVTTEYVVEEHTSLRAIEALVSRFNAEASEKEPQVVEAKVHQIRIRY